MSGAQQRPLKSGKMYFPLCRQCRDQIPGEKDFPQAGKSSCHSPWAAGTPGSQTSRFTGFMVCPPPAGLGQPMGQHRSVLGWLFPVPTWKELQQPLCPAYFSLFLLKSCQIPAPVQWEPSQPTWGRDEVPIIEGPFPRECSLCSGVGFPHPRVLPQPRSSQSDTDLPLAGYRSGRAHV